MQGSRIPAGRKGVLFHVSEAAWQELKFIAIRERTTLQSLMTEATNDLLRKRGDEDTEA